MEPSGRLIQPTAPVTPAPAVAGPVTGGQRRAQLPVQFEVAAVSGANQYSVNPAASVSTVTPLILSACRMVPAVAGPGGGEPGRSAQPAAAVAASTAAAAVSAHRRWPRPAARPPGTPPTRASPPPRSGAAAPPPPRCAAPRAGDL